MLTDMTRGGQVQIHKFRMIKQILAVTFSICLTVMLCTFIYKISQRQNEFELNDAGTYIKAFIANNYHPNKLIHEDKEIYVDVWNSWNHDYHIEKASDIEKYSNRYKTAFYNSIYILKEESIYAGTVGGVVLTLVIVFWIWNGRRSMAKKQITGGKILKPHESNKILAKKNLKSDLKIGDLHLVKEKETSHILITGTTGSGKSNCMYNLLPQVRIKKQGAIIVDFTGNMVERYYEEKREDVILNPFDERSYAWNFWDDVRNSYNTKIIASSLYSSRGYDHDQIWDNSSQQFFIDAVEVTSKKEEKKISTLYELLAIKKLSELTKILSGKPSASVFDSNNDKTAMSVRTNTIAYLDWMKLMIDQDKKDKQISIRECYERAKKGAWIFLSSSPKQRSSLRSFYSVLIELFISELMEHGTSYNRRIWMIIDELFALKKTSIASNCFV